VVFSANRCNVINAGWTAFTKRFNVVELRLDRILNGMAVHKAPQASLPGVLIHDRPLFFVTQLSLGDNHNHFISLTRP